MSVKRYNVTVDGVTYDVTVEETEAGSAVSAPAARPAPSAPEKTVAKKSANVGSGAPVSAPLNGSILDIKVSVGASVKKGDLLMILEAMKMENEILAPNDGKIESIAVSKGDTVGAGDILCTLM